MVLTQMYIYVKEVSEFILQTGVLYELYYMFVT